MHHIVDILVVEEGHKVIQGDDHIGLLLLKHDPDTLYGKDVHLWRVTRMSTNLVLAGSVKDTRFHLSEHQCLTCPWQETFLQLNKTTVLQNL